MIYDFGGAEKSDLCFQSQEHMSMTDSQYLQNYIRTYVCVNG